MRSLNTLQREAAKSTAWRGHKMQWRDMAFGVRFGQCRKCHRQVVLIVKPLPNQIDIGGEAVALNCND